MAEDLQRLEDWLSPLTRQLGPNAQRRLGRSIAIELRKDNARNIRRQVGPDGGRWDKRKAPREVAKPIRYFYKARDGHERELEMSSYRNEGDRIVGYDKEAGALRTMLKKGMLRSMSPQHPSGGSAQKRRAQYMLTGFARSQFMRIQYSSQDASVFFGGRAERLARIHHFGLRDSVSPGGAQYDYPARPLLGIGVPLRQRVSGMILDHLAGH